MMAWKIDELLTEAVNLRASDIHLKVGNPPAFRIDGSLIPQAKFSPLSPEDGMSVVLSLMSPAQQQRFKERGETDFSYSATGVGRFRANAFQQRGYAGVVLRVIPNKIPGLKDLNLPPVLETLALEHRGLIMVTGTTGSGKSTTLAAMIDWINSNRDANIVTIEDPIEFIHQDRRSILSQREIGIDTESFSSALRSALRQDPDVILVGEMRDMETISTALVAAETGHLVMSTLHTLDATETINRIISVFPPHQQQQIRIQLAAVIKGIVSQRLVPRSSGKGRAPAVEIMVATETIRECIVDPDKTRRVTELIAAGQSQYGMQTFDQSLYDLYRRELITIDEALKWATNPQDFMLKVKGIQSTSEMVYTDSAAAPGPDRQAPAKSQAPAKPPEKKSIFDRFGN
jgi:twitching motility protein PilT